RADCTRTGWSRGTALMSSSMIHGPIEPTTSRERAARRPLMLTMSSFRRARNLSRSFLLLTISAAVFGAPLSSCNYPGPAAFRAWYTLSAQEREEGSGAVPPADAPAPALDDPYLDELLGRALRSTYPEERRMAMDAIGDLGGRAAAALPYIVPSLGDPEPRVREKVIDSLRDISVRAGREAAASVAQ